MTAVLIALTWVFVLVHTIPRAISSGVADYGFFTGVAERLRVGDVLYIEVWDNKDPLVFYSLALARSIGPNGVIGAWLLEIVWIVIAAAAVYVIARFQHLTRPLSSYLGFGLTPLILLGAAYFMGSTHLPALALLLVAVALVYSRHPFTAGVIVGVLLLFKLVMVPMAFVVVITAVLALRRRADLRWIGAGFATVVVVGAVVLAIRGELFGFLETQIHNVLYSQSPIVSAEQTGLVERVKRYLVILVNPQVAAIELVTVSILTWSWFARKDRSKRSPDALWWITTSAFLMAVITIAITGKWFHHAQGFGVSSSLALVLVVARLRDRSMASGWMAPALAALLTYPLAGLPQPITYAQSFTDLSTRWVQSTTVDTMTRILRDQEPGAVSFVGETVPQSSGLDEWTIACRHIAQRPFNPQEVFDETLECLPTSEIVVISKDITTESEFPAYDAFLAGVRDVLGERFTCEQVETFSICRANPR